MPQLPLSQALAPIYSTPQPNTPIPLYSGPVTLEQNGQRVTCDVEITFEWTPSPDVTVTCTQNSGASPSLFNINWDMNQPTTIDIPGTRGPVPFHITKSNWHFGRGGNGVEIRGECAANDPPVFGGSSDLQYVIFHLVNFKETLAEAIKDGGKQWAGRTTAEFDGWKLTVDTLYDYDNLEKALQAQRGYGITHVARLERVDGSLFGADQAKSVLEALCWFLSFSRGFWSSPILPCGFDAQGKKVWEEWQALRATAWCGAQGWFSDRQYVVRSFQEALRGFWRAWNNPVWDDPTNNNTPLRLAIHWFISANTDAGGIEGSIILAQTGLELMAWVRLVEDKAMRAGGAFNALSAAQKFEALLVDMGVSAVIPVGLSHLVALAATRGWANGPTAIAGYRNTLVHPNRRAHSRGVTFFESYEILELAVWYLELALLSLFDYQGYYVNRVRPRPRISEVTELVPWAPPVPTASPSTP